MTVLHWIEVLMTVLLIAVVQVSLGDTQTGVFKLLYNGLKKIDNTYNTCPAQSKTLCATCCLRKPGCSSFTFDTSTRGCTMVDPLSSLITTVAAPSTLLTYYLQGKNGRTIHKTPSKCLWQDCKAACEAMGGRLGVPKDHTQATILHEAFGETEYIIGIYRDPSVTNVWYDMDGQVLDTLPIPWYSGEPNNYEGIQYYLTSWDTYASDIGDNNSPFYGMCEV